MNLNKVSLLGNLTSDVNLRSTPTGQSVATFGLATNRFYKDKSGARQQQAEFHNVVLWGRQAEIASQFLVKGGSVLIEGRIQTRSYTDKQNQQRRVTEIICEAMQLGPRTSGAPSGARPPVNTGAENQAPAVAGAGEKKDLAVEEEIPIIDMDGEGDKVEDLPF